MQEFDFAKNIINKRMVFGLILLFVMILTPPTIFVISGEIPIETVLTGLPYLILMAAVIFIIMQTTVFKILCNIKVIVSDDKIVKQSGKKEQSLLWSDISKVELRENPKGSVIFIILYRNQKKELYLGGFNDMDKIAQLIKEKIGNNVSVQVKSHKIDWTNPKVILISGGLAMIVTTAILFSGKISEKWLDISGSLFYLIWGISDLIYRPLTKINLRLKWVDIIIGIGLIISGILRFIYIF